MTNQQETRLSGNFLIGMYSNFRRFGALLVLGGLSLFTLFVILTALMPSPSPQLDYSKLGIHLLLDDGRNDWPVAIWPQHVQRAGQISSDGGIAVQVVHAGDYDPQRWQVFLDLSANYNLTPVLRLATTYDFELNQWHAPQADSGGGYVNWGERAADFINALQWPTEDKHIILLNEPNRGDEWGGRPDPQAYAQFVVDVVPTLRQEVEGVRILNAALDLFAPHTGSQPFPGSAHYFMDANSFMEAMQSAQPGIFAQFDFWNSHAYPLAFSAHPSVQRHHFDFMNDAQDTTSTAPPGIFNQGINGYLWELWKLSQYGIDGLPVMITETGWRHRETTHDASRDGGENYPDAATAARYFDLALRGTASEYARGQINWIPLLADERVLAVAPFAFNGVPHEWGHTNWLQLDSAGRILGTYAMFELVAAYPLE